MQEERHPLAGCLTIVPIAPAKFDVTIQVFDQPGCAKTGEEAFNVAGESRIVFIAASLSSGVGQRLGHPER